MRYLYRILFFVVLVLLSASPVLAQTTFTVTTTDDAGEGSLRQAIEDANANAGADVIAFNIAGNGPHTITPQTAFPEITDPVMIDGLSEPDTDCSAWPPQLMIEIDGSNAGDGAHGLTLVEGSDGSTVRGLVINSFLPIDSGFNTAIFIFNSNDNVVECNYLGMDVSGTQSKANFNGVLIVEADSNHVGGPDPTQRNLISGNDVNIFIQGLDVPETATNNRVQGNYLGTDATGSAVIGSDRTSVVIRGASGNLIGGMEEGAGNVIAGAGEYGIFIGVFVAIDPPATDNTVQGNLIGTDASGTQDFGNGTAGLLLFNASGNLVGGTEPGAGNVISGNAIDGIFATGDGTASADSNLIQGNRIGTDVTGTQALPNERYGITLFKSSDNLVGGTEDGARNVISGNGNAGVVLVGTEDASPTDDNRIENNYIGTDASGMQALSNGNQGIFLGRSNRTEVIGNLISGNSTRGIQVTENAPENTIRGNYIGTDATGNAALGNTQTGIEIQSPNNVVGGTTTEARNVIGANGNSGITIRSATGNRVEGNYIGVGADGTTPLGNVPFTDSEGTTFPGKGIVLFDGAVDNTVGGEAEGAGNRIAFNEGAGILLINSGTKENPLLGNVLYQNDGLGIDLGDDLVTDNGDNQDGPNAMQNYPVLTESILTEGASGVLVEGTLNATPSTTYRVEFFASEACDASGHGEGETFLGTEDMTTDADGEITFSSTLDAELGKGHFITATATDPDGNTSEFSACFEIVTGVAVVEAAEVPTEFALAQNYPNPFNPTTQIAFALPQTALVRLTVYDVLGREVAVLVDERLPAGRHEATFEASGLPSGMYLYQLKTGSTVFARTMLLVK